MRTQINGVIYVTCPDCKGEGTHPVTIFGIPLDVTRVKCKVCDGRGKLPEAELKGGSDVQTDNDSGDNR